MSDHERDLKDLASMFAMCGLIMNGDYRPAEIAVVSHQLADFWLKARNSQAEEGIAAITPKSKYERKPRN
jgi:hypothetical protein